MTAEASRSSMTLGIILLGIVFSLLSCALLRRIDELDIWYHLVIGQEIFKFHQIPATEFFVYPLLGKPVSFHEWGFGLLFYTAYKAAGYWGMSFVNAVIGATILFFLYSGTRRGRLVEPFPLLLLCALLGFIYYRLVYRPEMMLYLGLAAEIFLLERFTETGNRKWLLFIPLLTLLLSNFHPSALFLLALQGFYGIQAIVDAPDGSVRARNAALFAALLTVSFLTAAINPYGFGQIFLPLRFVANKELLQSIIEFLPTFQTEYKVHFLILCISCFLLLLFQPKRRLVDWILFVVFGWLGYRYARNVALFALVMYVPAVNACLDLRQRYLNSGREGVQRAAFVSAVLALVAVVALPFHYESWGAGPVPDGLPVQSAMMIKHLKPAGQLFNFYDYGGYLAWELSGMYRVSIDGRHYGQDKSLDLHDEVFQCGPRWQEILRGYGVSTIVVPAVLPYSGRLIPLVARLALDPEWVLAAREPAALLFVRRSAFPAGASVPALDKEMVWLQAIQESQKVLRENPEMPDAYLTRGKAALMLSDLSLAADSYRSYIRLKPGDREASTVLSLLESGRMGLLRQ